MRFIAPSLLLTLSLVIAGCGSSSSILGTIGNEKVPLREFEEMYAKSNGGWEKAASSSMEDRKKFLDLFVKYKLKLMEAERQGLLKDTSIQNELNGYRNTMANSYVLEHELIDPGMRKIYDRRRFDLRASHILLRVAPNAAPQDTLAAYLKAKSIIERAKKVRFDSLAVAFSEDPGSAAKGGDLGWFTQGRMVPAFEDGAYALSPGEVTPEPVRTRFGYHIIKLTGREPNRGSYEVAHILMRFSPSMSDTAAVRDTIEQVYQRIRSGKLPFVEAVQRYSDDPSSKARGGLIGSYERTGLPEPIVKIFVETPVDSVAPPYRAPYGYHIFKILAHHPLPTFEQAKSQLRQQYQQLHYTKDYENYIARLTERYHLNFDVSLRAKLPTFFDSTKTPASDGWKNNVDPAVLDKPLFTFASKQFTVRQFLDRLGNSPEFRQTLLTPKNLDDIIDRTTSSVILEEHVSHAEELFPEFKNLMDDYTNGVLIFRVDQDAVWKKAVVTDSMLHAYYDSTRLGWRWPDRVNIGEVYVKTDSMANAVYEKLRNGADFGEIAAQYTTRQGFREKKGEWGLRPTTMNDLTETAATMAVDSLAPPIKFYDGWSVIKVLDKDSSRVKTFDEVKPELTTFLQNRLATQVEQDWIDSLKRKYAVNIDLDVLSKAFTKDDGEGS